MNYKTRLQQYETELSSAAKALDFANDAMDFAKYVPTHLADAQDKARRKLAHLQNEQTKFLEFITQYNIDYNSEMTLTTPITLKLMAGMPLELNLNGYVFEDFKRCYIQIEHKQSHFDLVFKIRSINDAYKALNKYKIISGDPLSFEDYLGMNLHSISGVFLISNIDITIRLSMYNENGIMDLTLKQNVL